MTVLDEQTIDAGLPALRSSPQAARSGRRGRQVPNLNELAKNQDFAATVSFPNAFVANNDIVKNRPGTVKKVDAVLREAIDFRKAHEGEAIKLTAATLKISPDAVASDAKNVRLLSSSDLDKLTEDGTVDKWFTGMNDYFVSAGKLAALVDPKTYYTGDLFVAAGK